VIVRSLLARVFTLVVLATMVAHAQAKPELVLRQLEQDMAAATVRGDWQFADRVLAPEWTAIDSLGRQIDKPLALDAMKSKQAQVHSMQIYNVQVHFLKDDVAVVTGQMTTSGSVTGKTATIKLVLRFTDIFVQRQGKWVAVASQLTSVKGG
jgi:hypothetical protein